MNLELGIIVRSLLRNKLGVILIALQIAVTLAVIVNSLFIITERQKLLVRESGVDEINSFYLTSTGFGSDFNSRATVVEDLEYIRQVPGVIAATQINAIPISGGGWSMGLRTEPDDTIDGIGAANYFVDHTGLDALDIQLVAGRNFDPTEIIWREPNQSNWPDIAILTESLALTLFPDHTAAQIIGKVVYIGDNEPVTVIGIVDHLQAPWIGWSRLDNAMLTPENMNFSSTRYFIRTQPGARDSVIKSVEDILANRLPNRLIRNTNTMTETRERAYRSHNALITLLYIVIALLTVVTALGIIGLASFNVNRRRKQIGTRRALGASQFAVVRYFVFENVFVTTVGIAVGTGLTIGLNMLLVEWFAVEKLTLSLLPTGILLLFCVGILAVLGPAIRAARIPPAIATRTV